MSGFEYFALVMIFLALIVFCGAVLTLCVDDIDPEQVEPDELFQGMAQQQKEVRRVRAGPVTEINYQKRGES